MPEKSSFPSSITRKDLLTSLVTMAGLSKTSAALALEVLLLSIVIGLKEGKKVKIKGFGIFSVTHKRPRQGRNPFTGHPLDVPAKRFPKFKASKTLKLALASKEDLSHD